ncbi:hypothetical protein GW17_00023147 [Ensete ventricosum]|nr:hypothetical protein GW17_00023147 [Ensete ventricosum]
MKVVVVAVATGSGGGAGGGAAAGVTVDDALDVEEVVDVARDGDGSRVVEAVLLLGRPEQGHEERVVEVPHRHQEPLLLLPLASHPYRHPPFGRRSTRRRPSPPSSARPPVRQVKMNPRHTIYRSLTVLPQLQKEPKRERSNKLTKITVSTTMTIRKAKDRS